MSLSYLSKETSEIATSEARNFYDHIILDPLLQELQELGWHRNGESTLVTTLRGGKCYRSFFQIYAVAGNLSFIQSTACIEGDEKYLLHPRFFVLKSDENLADFLVCYFRFFFGLILCDSNPKPRVDLAITKLHRLTQDKTKNLYLQDGCVFSDNLSALSFLSKSPLKVIDGMNVSNLRRFFNSSFSKPKFNPLPTTGITNQSFWTFAAALKKAIHPRPTVIRWLRGIFPRLKLGTRHFCLRYLLLIIPATTRGSQLAASFFIGVLNPQERRIFSFIKGSHNVVSVVKELI